MTDLFTGLLVIAILVAPFTGLAATFYVTRMYLSDVMRPRSHVLGLLAMVCWLVEVISLVLFLTTLYRLVGGNIPRPIAISISALVLLSVLAISHLIAFYVWVTRRRSNG